jgi:RNA-directed DNA polymerase
MQQALFIKPMKGINTPFTKYITNYDNIHFPRQITLEEARKEWEEFDWREIEQRIYYQQIDIVKSYIENDIPQVYAKQKKLFKRRATAAWAVKHVSISEKDSGIDNITWNTYQERIQAIDKVDWLTNNPKLYKPSGIKRVWIPKANGLELRPLGIPTILDRAFQAALLITIEPIHDYIADENSFGFRKRRGCQHAIARLRTLLDKPKSGLWILDADISKCFDSIEHKAILEKVIIWDKRIINRILKAPILDSKWKTTPSTKFRTYPKTGTPQGGLISPLLCNIVLDGLEKVVTDASPKQRHSKHHLIRYADDFVCVIKDQADLHKLTKEVQKFLDTSGLQLNQKKTKSVHINEGFDFLGWNLQLKPRRGKLNKKSEQTSVLIIKPTQESVKRVRQNIKHTFQKYESTGLVHVLFKELNQITRGWCIFYRYSYHSQQTFISLQHYLWRRTITFLKRKHKGKSTKWITAKYLAPTEKRTWQWHVEHPTGNVALFDPSTTEIVIQRPHKFNQKYYTEEGRAWWENSSKGIKQSLAISNFRQKIYAKYGNKCGYCGGWLGESGNGTDLSQSHEMYGLNREWLYNHNPNDVELHRIIPGKDGGKYTLENTIPVHKDCHTILTNQTSNKKSEVRTLNFQYCML